MASLEKIMNMDEDSADPVQVKRERSASSISTQVPTTHTSSASSSIASPFPTTSASARHITSRGQPFARPSRQISSPSAYMAYSQPSDSPSLSSPSSSTTSRRSHSSISTGADAMDAMHYPQDHYNSNYGYGPSSSYSDPASRAYSTVPTASAPVKYTPVTGRLANNGVLAPDCRRHQLSHNPPELVCSVPGCGKTFHRKDLLERHQHRHEQDSRMSPTGGGGQPGPRYGHPMPEPPTTLAPRGYSPMPINSASWDEDVDPEMQHHTPGYIPEGMNHPQYGHGVPGYGPSSGWPEGSGIGSVPPPMQFPPGPGAWNTTEAPRTMSDMLYYHSTAPGPAGEYPVDLCGMPLAADPGHFDTHHHANSTRSRRSRHAQ
uniref:C2H2-type domain-containing protein n=1 Tax=Bionectria ochroleuca TaxID=29856 RepID=A0A0B7K7K2_BIOOC